MVFAAKPFSARMASRKDVIKRRSSGDSAGLILAFRPLPDGGHDDDALTVVG